MSRSKLFAWLVAALASIVISGCDGAGGDLASCSSAYLGTFGGDMEGDLLIQIDSDGSFNATFVQPDGTTLTGGGTVTAAGALEPNTTGLAVECGLDLDECACSGSWTTDQGSNFEKTGTFEMWIRTQ